LRSDAEAVRRSALSHQCVLEVARTLADRDGGGRIQFAEALSYRVVGDRLAAST
jgi:hypothetical protein